MNLDFNAMSVNSHFEQVAAHKLRATAISSAARKTPGMVAAMYAAKPSWVHELPLGQVAQVAEDLCDAGYSEVVKDLSENRTINKDYREVLQAVVEGESVIV
jgi:hypothetical protein